MDQSLDARGKRRERLSFGALMIGGLLLGLAGGWLLFRPDPGNSQSAPASTGSANSGLPLFTTLPAPAGAGVNSALAPAPDFTLKTLDGGEVRLAQFRVVSL